MAVATKQKSGSKSAAKGKAKALTKTEIRQLLAQQTGLAARQVQEVLDHLQETILTEVKRTGTFSLPGLVKIVKVYKPATPAQKGVPNPFKPGELMDRPAKPASNKVKVRPLKMLKDAVN